MGIESDCTVVLHHNRCHYSEGRFNTCVLEKLEGLYQTILLYVITTGAIVLKDVSMYTAAGLVMFMRVVSVCIQYIASGDQVNSKQEIRRLQMKTISKRYLLTSMRMACFASAMTNRTAVFM